MYNKERTHNLKWVSYVCKWKRRNISRQNERYYVLLKASKFFFSNKVKVEWGRGWGVGGVPHSNRKVESNDVRTCKIKWCALFVVLAFKKVLLYLLPKKLWFVLSFFANMLVDELCCYRVRFFSILKSARLIMKELFDLVEMKKIGEWSWMLEMSQGC